MQLTKPQAKLLRWVCVQPCYVADYYPPALALVRVGLCEWHGTRLRVTEKGRQVFDERKAK